MTPHINLLSVDHSEMASDKRKFASDIFAIEDVDMISAKRSLYTNSVKFITCLKVILQCLVSHFT